MAAAGDGRRRAGVLGGVAGGVSGTGEQICWFHKAGNVLDKMPSKAKPMIREMWQAPPHGRSAPSRTKQHPDEQFILR